MTVPTTNIGMSHIQTEFGGANPISMSEYYAGGSYVPSGQTNNAATAVPTSGTISIGNFTGATKLALGASLVDTSVWDFAISPNDAYAFIRVQADGTLDRGTGAPMTWTTDQTWKTGTGTGGDYQCRWTNTSGTLSSGTAGTWLTLSSDQSFGVSVTTNGFATKTCVGTLEIRMTASPNTVFDSCTVTLQADVEI